MRRALLILCLAAALGVCGCQRDPAPTRGGGIKPEATAARGSTSRQPPTRPANKLGRLFARLPSSASIGWRPLAVPHSGLAVRQPPEWNKRQTAVQLRLRAGDKSAAVVLWVAAKPPPKRELDQLLAWMGVEQVSWDEPTRATLGAARLSATARAGTANLGERDAEAWWLFADVPGGKLVVLAAVARGAEAQRRVLLDCLRTLHARGR